MRFYAIGNMYLSSIQQGIQAFHCLGEMVADYSEFPQDTATGNLYEWMHNHKTLICLNGGNNASLIEFNALLNRQDRNGDYPIAEFHEDEQSMGGMLTCVGIVLPERLYDAEWVMPNDKYPAWQGGEGRWFINDGQYPGTQITGWEADILTAIKRMGLAR